jgi:hypothetical protein
MRLLFGQPLVRLCSKAGTLGAGRRERSPRLCPLVVSSRADQRLNLLVGGFDCCIGLAPRFRRLRLEELVGLLDL